MKMEKHCYFFNGKPSSIVSFFYRSLSFLSVLFLLFLSGCANPPRTQTPLSENQHSTGVGSEINYLEYRKTDQLLIDAMTAFLNGEYADANRLISPILRKNPVDANAHFINALSYHGLALKERDYSYLKLADTGYQLARKFNPDNTSVMFLHGATKYLQRNYRDAQNSFVLTALYEPYDWQHMYALAVSSYQNNDIATALSAINQTLLLDPPDDTTYQNAAIINAIAGRFNDAETNARKYARSSSAFPFQVDSINRKIDEWRKKYNQKDLQLADLDVNDILGGEAQEGVSEDNSEDTDSYESYGSDGTDDSQQLTQQKLKLKRMILVDMILISTKERKFKSTGINLFNGLKLQYTQTPFSFTSSAGSKTITRSLGISIPQIIYSLNIFNHEFSNNRVLAKPTLIVTEGKQSEFFSGSVLHVELSPSVSSFGGGNVQEIQIGLKLSLKGTIIDENNVELEIQISRASLDNRSERPDFNNFAQTSKAVLNTTAVLPYDQTLLLGGFSDYSSESLENKVPIIGDIPLLNTFFNESTDSGEQGSILILVTPRKPDVSTSDFVTATPPEKEESAAVQTFQSRYQIKANPNFEAMMEITKQNFLKGARPSDVDGKQGFIDIKMLESRLRKYIREEF